VSRLGRRTRQERYALTLTVEEFSPLENLSKPGSTAVSSESKPNQNPRSNPVCLEIGVTIRSLPGEKDEPSPGPAEPTREEARTVIVFDNGAVLRLASNFPPGQAVIVSNPQGRDVVCRIVNTRNLPNVKGYIEVEFLEPITDFWGIHKPEGQSHASSPPAAVVTQPKAVTQPQIVSSAPIPEAPAPARVEPAAPEAVALIGKAPSFEDIAEVVHVAPPPIARVKTPEPTPRIPVSRSSNDSTPHTIEAARSYSPAGTSAPATELTSLSATWEGTPAPARMPSTSNDILGKFSASHATSESASTGSPGKTPLILGGAAVILIALGAGMFFMRRGSSVTPSVAPVATVSQPAARVPPAPVSIPTPDSPVVVDQPVAEPRPQALPLSPAISSTSPIPKEIAATSTSSLQQAPRRQTSNVAATQPNQVDVKQPDPSTLRPQVARNLKMSAPTVESQSGTLVDGSVPNIDDATVSGAVGAPGGGLISTVSHPNVPPPPALFPSANSSGKTASEPKLIFSTRPVYPPLAKQSNVEGDVIVAAEIDATGKVVGAKATAGPMYLRQAALDAIRNWKYEPATLNGKPTSTQISVKIQFRLK
jgi:TonB family protein